MVSTIAVLTLVRTDFVHQCETATEKGDLMHSDRPASRSIASSDDGRLRKGDAQCTNASA